MNVTKRGGRDQAGDPKLMAIASIMLVRVKACTYVQSRQRSPLNKTEASRFCR